MKRFWVNLLVFLPVLVLLIPEFASAALWDPIIDGRCKCVGSAPDWGCVIQAVQNTMNLAVSLGVVVATLVIAYAGAVWMVSPVNPQSREMGRTMLLNAVIGLLVLLAGWIFVDFLMKQVYNEGANSNGVQLGPWNEILKPSATGDDICIEQRPEHEAARRASNPGGGGGIGVVQPTQPTQQPTGQPSQTTAAIAARICTKANEYRGQSTTACNCGGNACAWAVNEVLKNADLSPIGSIQVVGFESGLQGGRGQSIAKSAAVCGDIVILTGAQRSTGGSANHMGICMDAGCNSVLSNSSSRREFSWSSGPDFGPSFVNATPRFYRVKN